MPTLAHWTSMLDSDNLRIRVRAARHLVTRADTPLDVLVTILTELSDQGLGAGTRLALLGRTDPDLADRMGDCLVSSTPFARETACDVLARLGDPRAATDVLPLLDDPVWPVRRAAIIALGMLGDRSAVAPLRERYLDVGDANLELALYGALQQLDGFDGLPSPSWRAGHAPPD
ncbi:MAG: HEAT repeat domain-containing protein [Actinomycetota bacterium]